MHPFLKVLILTHESFINIIYLYRNLTFNNKSVPLSFLAYRSNSFQAYFEIILSHFSFSDCEARSLSDESVELPKFVESLSSTLFISQPPSPFSFKEILSSSSTPF